LWLLALVFVLVCCLLLDGDTLFAAALGGCRAINDRADLRETNVGAADMAGGDCGWGSGCGCGCERVVMLTGPSFFWREIENNAHI